MSNVRVSLYDAVGVDSEKSTWFIGHVGMSLDEVDFTKGTPLQLRMVDMGPPLGTPESSTPEKVDVVGTAKLSSDEVSMINTFICEVIYEYKSLKPGRMDQYVVRPHFVQGNDDFSARRFSCAGFVFECYLQLEIRLVDTDALLLVDQEKLELVYPLLPRILVNREWRDHVGLAEDGPWPVLLPGYLFHSLNRDAEAIRQVPYKPQAGDECFPRRETEQPAKADS